MKYGKKVAFHTLGCKVNQYETESIKKQFKDHGYEEVSLDEVADFYIVNSCTVTSIADKKTRNILSRAKKLNEDSAVIITGCYAQTDGEELLEKEYIDHVIGNTNKQDILKFVEGLRKEESVQDTEKTILSHNIFDDKSYQELEFATMREMSRAYIKIQDGCNEFCSYCKIPFARGRSRSRTLESIRKEATLLSEEGFKEIILIGINLGAYGDDLEEDVDFEDLLEEVSKVDGIERIRLGSIYPDRINERFIKIMRENKKMMPHLHISLQSCSDNVLEGMRRKYTKDLILEKLTKLKEEVNDLQLTADIIVGFPGETDENHKESLEVIKKIEFSDLHIFPYSDRENTLAASLKNKVKGPIKKERAKELEELRKEMKKNEEKRNEGRITRVLIEGIKEGEARGYSANYHRVRIKDNRYKINSIIEVKLREEGGKLYGEQAKEV